MSADTPLASDELTMVGHLIDRRSEESQRRIAVVASLLRDLLVADKDGEVMLAFTLVMAEVSSD